MNDQQEDLLNDFKLRDTHILLKPEHSDFLKTIDDNNMSNAVRVLIEKYMRQTRWMKMERYLLYIILIIAVITLGLMVI